MDMMAGMRQGMSAVTDSASLTIKDGYQNGYRWPINIDSQISEIFLNKTSITQGHREGAVNVVFIKLTGSTERQTGHQCQV